MLIGAHSRSSSYRNNPLFCSYLPGYCAHAAVFGNVNTRASIMTPVLIIRIFNTLRKLLVIPFSLASPPFTPVVVAILRDLKDLAHAKNGEELTMLMNKLEFYGWGCAKMLIAFFNMSLSCLKMSFSRFNLFISSSIGV